LQNGPLREFGIDEDAQHFSVQIWGPDGTRIYLSHPRQELPHQAPIGFATIDTGHGQWRVFGMQQAGQMIQVAQPMQVRDQLALAAAWRTVAPFLLMLPTARGADLDRRRPRPATSRCNSAGSQHAHTGSARPLARKPGAQ
jgi:hypothetical protein